VRHTNLSDRVFPFMLVLAVGSLGGCASSGPVADRSLEVIDAHVLTSFDGTLHDVGTVMHSKDELAAEMKRNHVVGAVSTHHPGGEYIDLSDLNVIQCASLGFKADTAGLDARFRSGRYRCIEISPADAHLNADDPAYEPVYGLAEVFHVPVVLRTGPPQLTYSDPRAMESAVRRHPDVTFVLAHDGSPLTADQRDRDSWLGVHRQKTLILRFEDDPWIQAAAEVAYRNPNVVLDGSALLAGDLRGDSREQIRTYVERRVSWILHYVTDPRKLMFGSGWPLTDVSLYLEAFKSAIAASNWQAVLHDNAARVYGFAAPKSTN
jgi:predicted TIM-barrel fold metal-dependent hydrolase